MSSKRHHAQKSNFLIYPLHAGWDGLYILPDAQSQSIGEELIRWGFRHFNLGSETIITFTECPGLFMRLGWQQVDVLVVDPQPWARSGRSELKSFRVFVLVRKPGGLPSSGIGTVGEMQIS